MTCDDYPFYLCKKSTNPVISRWYGRLIIPLFKQGKLIFYQGRDLSGQRQAKYLSVENARDNVLYGYDNIYQKTDTPLYIVEGFFDAYVLNGVAVLGSKMTQNQIRWINQTHREKVIIPDRYGDGVLLAEQALELGWNVSTPDWGACKDVNDAVMKYGLLYTLHSIKENTCSGFKAHAQISIYCKK
jgi:DNA primase